ncbi:unnamed protein product [Rotaria sp. Silwood1]|nr:unnamed protein product [Rotaria sp. Silwood1]CAF1209529.1 unnamed protein product [Rotaria sp. Silwood1]
MLLPGLKCKVTVDKTRVNGLEVSFGEVKGFIHAQNFPTLKTSIDDFSPEQELEATILSIDPTTKLIHYSIQPHFLSLNSPPSILDNTIIGSIQTCTVIRNIGSLLVIRIPSLNQYEIVSSSQLTDEKYDDIQQILNSFKSGLKIQYDIQSYLIFIIHFILFRCRIIGISLASNLAICSLKQSIIEAPFITYSDIQIGSSVKGSITHVDENGLIINLTKYINGFVPIIHNADIPIKETLNKFPLKVIECENDEYLIGNVITERRRKPITVTLTRYHTSDFVEHQSALMRLDLSSNKDKQRDEIYWSHLSYINISMKKILSVDQNIFEYGLFIDLPNTIIAFAPHKHLDLHGILESIDKKYRNGKTVFVRILQLDEEKNRCIVSLKSLIYDGPLSKFFQEINQWIGFKCRCLIEKRLDDWFIGRLENGLPASLPYDPHYSTGDSIEGYIIDFNLPSEQFVITIDLKKPIKYSIDSSQTFPQCTILCQLPSYALAITEHSNHLIHLPKFSDLSSIFRIH